MIRTIFVILVLCIMITSCKSVPEQPMLNPNMEITGTNNPNPTDTFTTEPTLIQTVTSTLTMTPPPTPTPNFEPTIDLQLITYTALPNGWEMDVYADFTNSNVYRTIEQKYSFITNQANRTGDEWSRMPEMIVINGDKIRIFEYDQLNSLILIKKNSDQLFSRECGNDYDIYGQNISAFWAYDNHFVVEIICNGKHGLVLDGHFLNDELGYSSSYSSILFMGKLFYFFERDNKAGFVYDGKEYPLNFTSVSYYHCCGVAWNNPIFYSEQIEFVGLGENEVYVIVLGNLDSK